MGNPFQNLFNAVIELYIWCLIIWVVLSWLVAFNVVNTRNRFVGMLGDFLDAHAPIHKPRTIFAADKSI